MSDNNFVVYAYVRSKPDRFGREGAFYYIGKGRPGRPYESKGRKGAKTPKDKSNIVILHSNLPESTALKYEILFIQLYGRIDLYPEWGVLRNLTNGGEGTSGYIMKEEQKFKLSEAGKKLVGENNPNYGKKLSEKRKRQISEIAKERFKNKENNPMYGKTHTPEVRKILSDKAKSKVGRQHPRTNLHDWTHEVYGEFKSLSILELIELFPEDNLKYSTLYDVVKERCIHAKGWKLLSNKNLNESDKFKSTKKLCAWKHPEHGVYENISAPDLVKLFPELNRQSLNKLSNGKILVYRGWIVLNQNCNGYSFESKKSNWYHKEHGLFKDYTVKQLCEQFKEMNLMPSKLSLVRSGKVSQHKGWKIQNL